MRLPKALSSTIIIIILVLILGVLGVQEYKQWRKRQLVQREINSLVQQQQELEQKNLDLESSLNLFDNKDYREKLAREQLNLKKDGEIVVNFPAPQPAATPAAEVALSNPQKWWQYFFGPN